MGSSIETISEKQGMKSVRKVIEILLRNKQKLYNKKWNQEALSHCSQKELKVQSKVTER
jgi:hypothetical protein